MRVCVTFNRKGYDLGFLFGLLTGDDSAHMKLLQWHITEVARI